MKKDNNWYLITINNIDDKNIIFEHFGSGLISEGVKVQATTNPRTVEVRACRPFGKAVRRDPYSTEEVSPIEPSCAWETVEVSDDFEIDTVNIQPSEYQGLYDVSQQRGRPGRNQSEHDPIDAD